MPEITCNGCGAKWGVLIDEGEELMVCIKCPAMHDVEPLREEESDGNTNT